MHPSLDRLLALACSSLFTAALLAADTPPAAGSSGPVQLKAKWTTGERMVHRVTASTQQKLTMPGAKAPMEQDVTQVQEYAVTVGPNLSGGGQELGLEFLTMQLESALGTRTVLKFDSKGDPKQDADNPAGAMLRPLVGAKLKLLTTPSGKIDRVEGYEAIRQQMAKNAAPMYASMLEGMFGENLVDQLGVIPRYLPEKPVEVGGQWPLKMEFGAGQLGTITLLGTTTLKEWGQHGNRSCVLLESKGRLWSVAKPGATSIGSVSGSYNGIVWFDPKAGLQIESVSTQNLVVKVKAMNQEMTIPSVQVTTNTLIQAGPATQ
jgi:hypothetical protein